MKGRFTMLSNKKDTTLHALTVHPNNHRRCRQDRNECVCTNHQAVGLQYWDPQCCCSANRGKWSQL